MANQLVLAWDVDVKGASFGPTQAAAALAAVPLYTDATTDPVLGQIFGLTVSADVSAASGPSTATRTLTLNMDAAVGPPFAPPPFPCHPNTSTPPVLPYPLQKTVTLPGSFFVSDGSLSVPVTATQIPSLNVGDSIQFLSQEGVFYTVTAVGATSISIAPAYNGVEGDTGAFKEVAAPVTLAAIYSTSDLDTAGVATVPEIPAGSGAQVVELLYLDSTGAGPFSAAVSLTGRRPAAVALQAGSVDIAVIVNMLVISGSVGKFGNSIGQITLVELESALPDLPPNLPLGTGIGAAETTVGKVGAPVPRTFKTMTDDAQMLIKRHLAYLPPSFFALAQQQLSAPPLEGDFIVTTKSDEVLTTSDQTGVLSTEDFIEFAIQPGTIYTIAHLTPKIIKLTTPFLGIDTNDTGLINTPQNNNNQTKGNVGTIINGKATGARSASVTASPPTNDQLSGPLGQFVAPETAAPPPKPPLSPATVPVPVFLSDLFTQTLQLALAGATITPKQIALA